MRRFQTRQQFSNHRKEQSRGEYTNAEQAALRGLLEENIRNLYATVLKTCMKKAILTNFVTDVENKKQQSRKKNFLFWNKEKIDYKEIECRFTTGQRDKSMKYADNYLKQTFFLKYKNTELNKNTVADMNVYLKKLTGVFLDRSIKESGILFQSKVFNKQLKSQKIVLTDVTEKVENKVKQEYTHSFVAINKMEIWSKKSFIKDKNLTPAHMELSKLLAPIYKKRNIQESQEILNQKAPKIYHMDSNLADKLNESRKKQKESGIAR
ncbi:hypothetical protein CBF30_06520 [Vagococcus entomophilus]|uniref:Uncharacterized protein n=2 Tax=Vagococcus entomophilus TaxID=1160095 RepID=A0A430AG91_9ENTE|nr:hypothetical protein CBF30_06520 [Vagococcus entomophilus]